MAGTNSKPVYCIMDLYESDRPRERLASLGPKALTNAELIASLLRVCVKGENTDSVGQRLLNKFGGLTGLHCAPFADLKKQYGLGDAKAAQNKAAIELGRRLSLNPPRNVPPSAHRHPAANSTFAYIGSYAFKRMELWLAKKTRLRILAVYKKYYPRDRWLMEKVFTTHP